MNIEIEYSDKQVSPWGGLILMKQVLDKTGIREKLRELNLPQSKSNNSIESIAIVESFFASVWIGATAFSQTSIIKLDETVKQIFDWARVPSGTTFGRFFKKFSWKENNRIFPELNEWFFKQIKFDTLTLDVDSSVMTRYGEQEGSLKGYNPHKKGRDHIIRCLPSLANCGWWQIVGFVVGTQQVQVIV